MFRRYGRRSIIPMLLVSAATSAISSTSLAGPVMNDTCATAEVIPATGPFPHMGNLIDNLGMATTQGDPKPSCVTTYSRGVWYKFTPTVSGDYQLSTCNPSTGTTIDDSVIAIYTSSNGACNGTMTETIGGCNDDSCGRLAAITASLTAGTTYYVVVSRWGGGVPPANSAALQLEVANTPSNDSCANPANLPLNTSLAGSLTLSANDFEVSTSAPNCYTLPLTPGPVGQLTTPSAASGRDVVYSFTAEDAGNYSFKAQHQVAGGNIIVHVASDCPTGTGPHTLTNCLGAANRNAASTPYLAAEEVACVPLSAGQTVYVYVDEATAVTSGGRFSVEATKCARETEPNDDALQTSPFVCGVVGAISPGGDADYYSLGASAAGARVFAMADGSAGNNADFDMRIVTDADTLEYDDGDNSSRWGASSPNIAGCPLTGSPAFLQMTHFSPSAEAEPYHMLTVVQPPGMGLGGSSATPETEGNNTFATANSAANLFFSGTISTGGAAGDVDLFKFCADEGDLIYLSIDGDPLRDETPIDPAVLLYDHAGNQLLALSDNANTSFSLPNPGTLSGTTPRSPGEAGLYRATYSGVHYAGVNTQSEGLSYSTGDYLYSIALNCLRGDQLQTDLAISITDTPDPVGVDATLDLEVTVVNQGSRTALDPVWTMPILPSTELVSVTAAQEWTCDVSGGIIECKSTCFAPGAVSTFAVKLKTKICIGTDPLSHTATITSKTGDIDTSNDVALELTQVDDPGTCDDGEVCTTADTCSNGVCVGGPPLDCNDGNVCTDETCVNGMGCMFTNNTASCDDSSVCTTVDSCVGGTCVGSQPIDCSDGNVCTDDLCDATTGCFSVNNTGPCQHNDKCTDVGICSEGVCVSGPPTKCPATNDCQEGGICDPATGLCAYYLKPDGTACNDGNACTTNDTCKSGACTNSVTVTCNSPPDACHGSGACDPMTGGCSYPLIGSDLDGDGDGDACDDDIDGDGISNTKETGLGMNPASKDSDSDGIDDCTEACSETDGSCFDGKECVFGDKAANTDGDDTIDALDSDSDNDGLGDNAEAGDDDLSTAPADRDANGVPDYRQGDFQGGGGSPNYSVTGGISCAYSIGAPNSTSGAAGLGALGLLALALRRKRR